MANGWTSERRSKQAELIETWKPWSQSTGPRTPGSQAKVAANAWKGGHRPQSRELVRLVHDKIRSERELVGGYGGKEDG